MVEFQSDLKCLNLFNYFSRANGKTVNKVELKLIFITKSVDFTIG